MTNTGRCRHAAACSRVVRAQRVHLRAACAGSLCGQHPRGKFSWRDDGTADGDRQASKRHLGSSVIETLVAYTSAAHVPTALLHCNPVPREQRFNVIVHRSSRSSSTSRKALVSLQPHANARPGGAGLMRLERLMRQQSLLRACRACSAWQCSCGSARAWEHTLAVSPEPTMHGG